MLSVVALLEGSGVVVEVVRVCCRRRTHGGWTTDGFRLDDLRRKHLCALVCRFIRRSGRGQGIRMPAVRRAVVRGLWVGSDGNRGALRGGLGRSRHGRSLTATPSAVELVKRRTLDAAQWSAQSL